MRCFEEWTINLPALLEFLNIFIIHDFLLRVYLVTTSQIDKYRNLLVAWTLSVVSVYTLAFIVQSAVYCRDTAEISMQAHSTQIKIAEVVECGAVLIFNPLIVGVVLKSLRKRIVMMSNRSAKVMFNKILILGILFEIAISLRIVLISKQDDWKQNYPQYYNMTFAIYILLGEVCCQIVLIYGIVVYTHKIKKKHNARKNLPSDDRPSSQYEYTGRGQIAETQSMESP